MRRQIIKIPKVIGLVYSRNNKLLIISKFFIKKILKLKLQVILIKTLWILRVSSIGFITVSNHFKDKLKCLWKTTIFLIKQLIIETWALVYQQLKFIGLGFWVFNNNNLKKKLLLFKIGYSHFLYFKTVFNVNLFTFKTTELFIYGRSFQIVKQISSLIKQLKKPDFYKGKGIFYNNENLNLKTKKKT